MPDENSREVFRALREHTHKYVYFLLTAAGAGIALAVNQTQHAALSLPQAALGAAVASWAVSFWCGVQHLKRVSAVLIANGELLSVQSGTNPRVHRQAAELGVSPQEVMGPATEGLREAIAKQADRANRFAVLQFKFLAGGAVLYVSWHLLEMYLRTVSVVPL
jgi:hypothetical protein